MSIVDVTFDRAARTATVKVSGPQDATAEVVERLLAGDAWWPLACRERLLAHDADPVIACG